MYQVAEVVRNLALREATKGLSAGEKAMLVKARSVLVSELSASRSTSPRTTRSKKLSAALA